MKVFVFSTTRQGVTNSISVNSLNMIIQISEHETQVTLLLHLTYINLDSLKVLKDLIATVVAVLIWYV